MANKKKKKARARSGGDPVHEIRTGEASQGEWRLVGRDALSFEDGGFYPLPGDYPNQKAAEKAARARLRYLEVHQPTKTSGGQRGIQDRVWVIRPDGTSYRIMK